ncbi:MAG: hypothetical protein KAH67_03740 [Flavobacteriaceae bacterium]|nr:hypothetical protein [Flavobacteriaceae bacterium]
MIKKLLLFTFILTTTFGFAQRTNSSPYSFFGIGDQAKLKSVEEIGMGQFGGALNSEYHLSLTNPASYASLKYTTYVFSGGNKVTSIDDGEDSQTSSAASLTYIALGIPIKQNQGLAFGLQLNTAVGYSLLDQKFDDDLLIETNLLTGEGGTNRVFLGYAYQLPFNLNVGVEAAYIFGGIENNILNRRLGVQLATESKTDSYVKGFSYKIGAQYVKDLKNNLKLKMGVSATIGNTLNEKGDIFLFTSINTEGGGNIVAIDTINNYKAKIKSPIKPTLSIGIGEDNKWLIGAEYTFQDAINFNGGIYDDITNYYYSNSNVISLGGFYLPKYNSIASYFDRVTYRAGLNYKKLGLVINETEIEEYGISFGVSLPLGLRLSNANLGFEIGKRGTTDNNLVKENFYNFRLSLSLNDKWFKPRPIY